MRVGFSAAKYWVHFIVLQVTIIIPFLSEQRQEKEKEEEEKKEENWGEFC